jgi:hypothetical protein
MTSEACVAIILALECRPEKATKKKTTAQTILDERMI